MTRETDIAEDLADRIVGRALIGVRLEVSFFNSVRSRLSSLFKDLTKELVILNPPAATRSQVRKARLSLLISNSEKAIKETYRSIKFTQDKELSSYYDTEVVATQVEMRRSFNENGLTYFVAVPKEKLDRLVMGSPVTAWWDAQERKISQSVIAELRKGLIAGETVDGFIRRLTGDSGVYDDATNYAKTLVKTSVMAMGNLARFSVFEANLTYIDAYMQLSRLDNKSSKPCIARAGLLWDARTKEPRGHDLPFEVPPLHYGCRSVPVVKLKGGEAPKDQDSDQWLRSLSSGQQDRLLGKERANLYRQGDIIARDLIDQSNRPLSLAELSETIGED